MGLNLKVAAVIGVAAIYFLVPLDFIPDIIPGLGYLDDIVMGVIGFYVLRRRW